ncbi:helix-turn-helix domain-containing protein [Myxococcus sp. AB036A]|uniref:helix-turn-helix domain-containing protein n=1 Tax=Myxococcus sp. AB036A TaxID=2562793 RepID=UPI00114658BC|nr:helix-turn-helix transcriptional regulator [Myxococcus sp. AB036A]
MNEKMSALIGTAARTAREQMGLTQAEVGERVGISPPVYSRLERGEMLPGIESFARICAELMLSSDEILGLAVDGPRLRTEDAGTLRRLMFLARKMDERKLAALVHVAAELSR